MSQTNIPLTAASFPAAPVAAPRGPRERRVRFGHLALAIALVVVGALGTTALVTMVSAKGAYLALADDVEYGAKIDETDLVTVRVNSAAGLNPVRASDIDRVVGYYATMPLAEGTLLTEAHVTDQQFPADGEVRLGITLPASRLPVGLVEAGNLVMLVDTERESQSSREESAVSTPRTWQATVVAVADEDSGGDILGSSSDQETTIDVVVEASEAPIIASLAANNLLSVAVLPGQPGS